MANNQGSLM